MNRHVAAFLAIAAAFTLSLSAQEKPKETTPAPIPAAEAKTKIGQVVTVTGKVAEVNKTEKIVRINLGEKYPKQDFTAVIFPDNFKSFPDVEKLAGKTIEVNGKVAEFKGRPQIVLSDKAQLRVIEEKKP